MACGVSRPEDRGCESFQLLTHLNLCSLLEQRGTWMGLLCKSPEQVSPPCMGGRGGIAPPSLFCWLDLHTAATEEPIFLVFCVDALAFPP